MLGCRTDPYPPLADAVKRTWASVPVDDVEVLFYYGGDEFGVAGTDVFLPVSDDLSNVGRKTIACFEYALGAREFDLIYRTNLSTYVDLPNLREFVASEASGSGYYAGKGGNYDSIDFASGSGYFLSRDLVGLVVENRSEWDHAYLDDVALGKLLRAHGIERRYAPRVVVTRRRDVRRVDLSEFSFRCKTDSSSRERDIELMARIHRRFEGLRTEGRADARSRAGATIRRFPAGSSLLRVRRRAQAAVRARTNPLRPPLEAPDRVAGLSAAPEDDAFLTGNGLAAHCRYVLNFDVLEVNERVDNDWWFCKADFLEYFFADLRPDDDFVLFSHNSDRTIGRRFRRRLRRKNLIAWFAQNPVLRHEKLRALPIGIANPTWPHGDQAALSRVQAVAPAKRELFDVSFSLATNPGERAYCLEQTGLTLAPPIGYPEYLERLASAYFCISPAGNGIDSHRTWEALCSRTIPVVTRSLVTEHHADFPFVVLEEWSQFRSIDFTPELYAEIWRDWDPAALRLDRYLKRVDTTIAALRA